MVDNTRCYDRGYDH